MSFRIQESSISQSPTQSVTQSPLTTNNVTIVSGESKSDTANITVSSGGTTVFTVNVTDPTLNIKFGKNNGTAELLFFLHSSSADITQKSATTFEVKMVNGTSRADVFTNIPYHVASTIENITNFYYLATAHESSKVKFSDGSSPKFPDYSQAILEALNAFSSSETFIEQEPNCTLTMINSVGTDSHSEFFTIAKMTDIRLEGTTGVVMTFSVLEGQLTPETQTHDILSITVDDFFSWVAAVGSVIAAGAACTVLEVGTAGAATAGCVGAVVGAMGAVGNAIEPDS